MTRNKETAMFNLTVCANVSVDLSNSSIRYSTHPHLLVFLATVMCLLAAFIVGTNIFFIVVLAYSRYRYRSTNVTDKREVLSDHSKIVSISFYFVQLIVGAFCLPLSIVQVISNGRWTIGHTICTVRIFVECLTELLGNTCDDIRLHFLYGVAHRRHRRHPVMPPGKPNMRQHLQPKISFLHHTKLCLVGVHSFNCNVLHGIERNQQSAPEAELTNKPERVQ
ncbi:5-hydroxytryptamine receptor 5A [Biomphalaria glabrata]|nr:5-hydroxytryptamine receptor 5A [Biomphalaria glabrata]